MCSGSTEQVDNERNYEKGAENAAADKHVTLQLVDRSVIRTPCEDAIGTLPHIAHR